MMQQNGSIKVILLIVVIAALAAGAFFYGMNGRYAYPTEGTGRSVGSPDTSATADVEAELQGMDLDGLDAEMTDMEKEISQ